MQSRTSKQLAAILALILTAASVPLSLPLAPPVIANVPASALTLTNCAEPNSVLQVVQRGFNFLGAHARKAELSSDSDYWAALALMLGRAERERVTEFLKGSAWQQSAHESFLPLLPRGLRLGHLFPVGMQAALCVSCRFLRRLRRPAVSV